MSISATAGTHWVCSTARNIASHPRCQPPLTDCSQFAPLMGMKYPRQNATRKTLLLLGAVLIAILLSGCTLLGGLSPVLPLEAPPTPTGRPATAVPTPRPVTPGPTVPPSPTAVP